MFRAFLFATVLVSASTALAADLPSAWNVGGRVITYDWVQFEGENGQVVALDKNTLMKMTTGFVEVGLYIDQGNAFSAYDVKKWYFDCHGHAQKWIDGHGPTNPIYLPPRSLLAEVSATACSAASAERNAANLRR